MGWSFLGWWLAFGCYVGKDCPYAIFSEPDHFVLILQWVSCKSLFAKTADHSGGLMLSATNSVGIAQITLTVIIGQLRFDVIIIQTSGKNLDLQNS